MILEKKRREGEGGGGRNEVDGEEEERERGGEKAGEEERHKEKKSGELAQSREQIAISRGALRVVPWLPIHSLFTAKQNIIVVKILPSMLVSPDK